MAYKQPPYQHSYDGYGQDYSVQPSKEGAGSPYGVNETSAGARQLHPGAWSKRTRVIVSAIIGIIVVIVVIVGAVVGTRNSKYPDYSPLTYHHVDTCKLRFRSSFEVWALTRCSRTGEFLRQLSVLVRPRSCPRICTLRQPDLGNQSYLQHHVCFAGCSICASRQERPKRGNWPTQCESLKLETIQ